MPENDKFFSVNIREYLTLENDEEAGEPALAELLSGFSCPKVHCIQKGTKKIFLYRIIIVSCVA